MKKYYFLFIIILIQKSLAQNVIIGNSYPSGLITIPGLKLNQQSFWISPVVSVADYSYENNDNELYLALVAAIDWKQRICFSLVMPNRRSDETGIGYLFANDLKWVGSRKRITTVVRITNPDNDYFSVGFSGGLWQLGTPCFSDERPRFYWNSTAGIILEKTIDRQQLSGMMEVVHLNGHFQLHGNRRNLFHMVIGYQYKIKRQISIQSELRYDQSYPKYRGSELPEIMNWYSASLGLKYTVIPQLLFKANVSAGFREHVKLFPKSENRFDLAIETIRIIWII